MAIPNSKKPQVAIMNAVHDLPVLVARDKGFFKDEGLDIDFVTTPGMAQVTTSHFVKFDSIFDRPLDSVYNEGGIDQYRMCEWGIMKRAVEAEHRGLARAQDRGARRLDVVLRHRRASRIRKLYEPEMLKDKADRGDAEQRLALHDAEDDGRLPRRRSTSRPRTPARCRSASRRCARQGRRGEPDGAVDQLGPEAGTAHPDRVALDAQRSRGRRTRRRDAGEDVPRPGARGRRLEKDPTPLRPLSRRRDGRTAAARRVPDLAPPSRARRSPTRASASTTLTTGR